MSCRPLKNVHACSAVAEQKRQVRPCSRRVKNQVLFKQPATVTKQSKAKGYWGVRKPSALSTSLGQYHQGGSD